MTNEELIVLVNSIECDIFNIMNRLESGQMQINESLDRLLKLHAEIAMKIDRAE